MNHRLLVATGNAGKAREFSEMLTPLGWSCASLKEYPPIPEPEPRNGAALDRPQQVDVGGSAYAGYPTYAPGSPYYFPGGVIGGGYVPGGWYGSRFWEGALLGGVAALAIPIIIHLFHKSRFQIVKWGAMHLLEAVLRTNQRRIRIESLHHAGDAGDTAAAGHVVDGEFNHVRPR